jgi:hypothetical protein
MPYREKLPNNSVLKLGASKTQVSNSVKLFQDKTNLPFTNFRTDIFVFRVKNVLLQKKVQLLMQRFE